MTNSAELDRAVKAKAVLEAPAFEEAFQLVRASIIQRIERCPLSQKETAEDLRRCLRLLNDVKLNLTTAVASGKVIQFRLEEETKRSKNPLRGLFR